MKKCFQVSGNYKKLKAVTKLKNGRSINLKTYKNDTIFYEIDYKYDNKGLHHKVINETVNNGKPVNLKKEEHHYLEFDKHKNWTKKLVKDFTNENWIEESVHIREIEYY